MIIKNLMKLFASEYVGEEKKEYNDPKQPLLQMEKVDFTDLEVQTLVKDFCGTLPMCGNIEIELHRILEILPRKRKKADAYKGIKSAMKKKYGVNLVITSSRRKGDIL